MRIQTFSLVSSWLFLATPLPAQPRMVSPPTIQIDSFMRRAAALGQFNGNVLVAAGGQVIYENTFGQANKEWGIPNTLDSRFEIASMTKAITAIVIFQLIDEGRIRLHDPVSRYLPDYPQPVGNQITIDQLLNHTSGLQEDIAFAGDGNPPSLVAAINADLLSNDSLVTLIAQRPLRFKPGTSYGYSSDAYAVLGAVIERVTNTSYWSAINARVLRPAGMTHTGVALLSPIVPKRASGYAQTWDGYVNAAHIGVSPAGGLHSTLRDLYALDRALHTDVILSPAAKERVFAVRDVATAYGWKTNAERRPDGRTRTVLRTTGGLPGFGSVMLRVPSEDRVVILMSNTRDLTWRLEDFAFAINRIIDGEPVQLPRASIALLLAEKVREGARGRAIRDQFSGIIKDTVNYEVRERDLNQLGYYFFNTNLRIEAREVFELNVVAFPRSANVYDSLGEAQLALGDTTNAVRNYRRSLDLDPGNTNAADILKRLQR